MSSLATAASVKGSGLAAADVIQAINLQASSVVLAAGFEYLSAVTGTVSVLTVSLGTTTTASAYVSAYDLYGATVGAYPPANTAAYPIVVGNTATTLDLTIASLTGTLTGGTVRVWALVGDTADQRKPGLAALKS